MKLSLFSVALSLGLASAQGLPNNYLQVLTDLAFITAQTKYVTALQALFTPGNITEALAVQSASTKLQTLIQQATTDTQISEPFGDTGSAAISKATLQQTKPIKKSLATIVAQQPAFAQGVAGLNLSPIVLTTLQNLKSATDTLAAAITKQLTPEYAAAAPGIIGQIDSEFEAAIAAYSPSS